MTRQYGIQLVEGPESPQPRRRGVAEHRVRRQIAEGGENGREIGRLHLEAVDLEAVRREGGGVETGECKDSSHRVMLFTC